MPDQRTANNAPGSQTYRIQQTYEITEVLGYWLMPIESEGEWLPIMGNLHDDTEYFDFPLLHYHVDPRFLNDSQKARAATAMRKRAWLNNGTTWHPAYREVVAHFPAGNGGYMSIEQDRTVIIEPAAFHGDHADDEKLTRKTRSWGIQRIRTRKRRVQCKDTLPPAELDDIEDAHVFRSLREAFPNAVGDRCPHRGYDLRSIQPDADGYRQCPLHQLRVRCPQQAGKRRTQRR